MKINLEKGTKEIDLIFRSASGSKAMHIALRAARDLSAPRLAKTKIGLVKTKVPALRYLVTLPQQSQGRRQEQSY